jgi:glycosyltransferase involved in cell wall biosynthesis
MTRGNSNPTIAVDTWVMGAHARHQGVHVYGTQLLKHFRELAPQYSIELRAFVSKRPGAHDADAFIAAPGFQPQPTRLLAHSRLWRFGGAWALASLQRADVVFNPHCSSLYAAMPVPTVTTIHDVIPLVLPWPSRVARTLRFLLWSAAKASRAIITVSEHSKSDLMRIFGLPDSRVHVVYNGCDHAVFNSAPVNLDSLAALKNKLRIEGPYVLHYGAIKPNKNLARLIRAYRRVLDGNSELNFNLVLVGARDSGYQDVIDVARENEGARGRVILIEPLKSDDLVTIIKGARLAVFPSLYEGFCLPMIECMACGTPTVAANTSCLPEISGGVLSYFDPWSEEEMAACIEAVFTREDLRRELAERGRARALEFEWRRCAEQTLTILANVARAGQSQRHAASA